jgi:HEAT repeat protein
MKRTDLRGADAEVLQILALQSGDPDRIRAVLDPRNRLSPSVLPHAIPLLGVRTVAAEAMQALQCVAEQRAGALLDALFDPTQPLPIRRRLARVLSICRSQSVADGLLLALTDDAVDVRVQSARALFRIRRGVPTIQIDAERVLDQVRTELAGDALDLAHVFTLLAFVLPIQPLRAAYRSLKGHDQRARGTAMEYLAGVLPKDVRERLLKVLDRAV